MEHATLAVEKPSWKNAMRPQPIREQMAFTGVWLHHNSVADTGKNT